MNGVQEVQAPSVSGVLLPDIHLATRGITLHTLMHNYIGSSSSRAAKDLLMSSNPSRVISDHSTKGLIEVDGPLLAKDPHTEAVRRYARKHGWSTPTVEDGLRLFATLQKVRFNFGGMKAIIIMHTPVKHSLLGITFERDKIVLSAHKADPREGWLCEKIGFVFRCT